MPPNVIAASKEVVGVPVGEVTQPDGAPTDSVKFSALAVTVAAAAVPFAEDSTDASPFGPKVPAVLTTMPHVEATVAVNGTSSANADAGAKTAATAIDARSFFITLFLQYWRKPPFVMYLRARAFLVLSRYEPRLIRLCALVDMQPITAFGLQAGF